MENSYETGNINAPAPPIDPYKIKELNPNEIFVIANEYLARHHQTKLQAFRKLLKVKKQRLTIIIPTKNEYYNLVIHLKEILPYGDQIIIIDATNDRKTQELAKSLGIEFYVQSTKGKGAAIKESRKYIKGDYSLFIDADGSHNPKEIPDIIMPIIQGIADHVTPSRMKGGSDELFNDIGEFIRLIGQSIITLGINYYFGVKLTDSQNGFRGIRTNLLNSLELKENITTIEQEMVIKTLKMNKKLIEVASHENVRHSGTSKINVKKVAFRYVYSWLLYLFFYKYKPNDR